MRDALTPDQRPGNLFAAAASPNRVTQPRPPHSPTAAPLYTPHPMKPSRILHLLVLLAIALPLAFAAGAVAGEIASAPAPLDLRLLIPVAVPMVISLAKLLIPRLPRASLPVIAIVLGAAAEFAVSGIIGTNTAWGAALGAAGVGLREVVDQIKKTVANIGI